MKDSDTADSKNSNPNSHALTSTFGQRAYLYTQTALYLGLCSGIGLGIYMMFRRYKTETNVPDRVVKSHRKLHGYMVNVSDGDTFRFYHVPLVRWPFTKPPQEKQRGVATNTILIRLSAVDAPEMAHFGNPEQPLAKEAKQHLYDQLTGRSVTVKPLAKDQYGRIVASVTYRSWMIAKKNAAHEMLKAGLATLYTGGNAQYDGEKEKLDRIQAEAKKAKRGVWKLKDFQPPAEYKRQHKKK
ncbi:putative endonuclease lcl3 [Coemansia spiralis]|uniref:Endonuclease lcl3 n=2 Tax=Coemansia TaxID=4863 RepID=A0A9W8G1I5_9FUNG|nr:hypothetical protein BX070DRAFT_229356 [Coemansia spiralis]KAJ1994633.1 putative endonuclease lcl3 [Coemansia umbellata]KAJ2624438.1 putative endonuclease lcl3 [Coemansia sp. RSA 1358]KAJ2675969.1 putative endonuclease lcl3 [Coemansia spiralis]